MTLSTRAVATSSQPDALNPATAQVKYRFDAFLSYAHEDEPTVAWLETYLSNTWVPGERKRVIFRDRRRLVAGVLSEELRRALADSRYLIVCSSRAAAESPWVKREIETFQELHPDAASHVLAARVGDPSDAVADLPAAFSGKDELYFADLRGFRDRLPRRERLRYEHEAASLLAPLVGLRDREQVLARVTRRLRALVVSAMILLVAMGSAWVGWSRWLATADGAMFSATRDVLAATADLVLEDQQVLAAARGLGALNQERKVRRLANFMRDPDFRAITIACGLAAQRPVDCGEVVGLLLRVDDAAAKAWPFANLLASASCGDDLRAGVEADPLEPIHMGTWAERLVAAGRVDAARAVLARPDFPIAERLKSACLIAARTGEQIDATPGDIAAWLAYDTEPLDRIYAANELLLQLDLAGRLDDPIASQIAAVGVETAEPLDPGIDFTWVAIQRLAAHLANTTHKEASGRLLARATGESLRLHPDYTPGWAWRSLAFARLGDGTQAATAEAQMARCISTQAPSGRDWRELRETEIIFVLADRWPEAFALVDEVGNDVIRIQHRAQLIELWAERVGRLPWPWCLGL